MRKDGKAFEFMLFWSALLALVFLVRRSVSISSYYQHHHHHNPEHENELQKIFKLRNEEDWRSVWHQEKHVRCRDKLLSHMNWACKKDIYRLDKRTPLLPPFLDYLDPDEKEENENEKEQLQQHKIFLSKTEANTIIKPWTGFIRRKRESKSITEECCSPAGCTWEEYAEYCPTHRRLKPSRRS